MPCWHTARIHRTGASPRACPSCLAWQNGVRPFWLRRSDCEACAILLSSTSHRVRRETGSDAIGRSRVLHRQRPRSQSGTPTALHQRESRTTGRRWERERERERREGGCVQAKGLHNRRCALGFERMERLNSNSTIALQLPALFFGAKNQSRPKKKRTRRPSYCSFMNGSALDTTRRRSSPF